MQLIRFERTGEHPDHDPASFGRASYLVVGMGQAGAAAYDAFIEQGERPLGLDADPAQIETQLAQGRRVIFGDAQDPELWHNIALDGIQAVIMTLPNVEAKMRSTHVLREAGFDRPIGALIRSAEDEPVLRAAGVSGVVLPITEAGRDLAEMCLQRTAVA
jgi:Trk K+ transport system NAD-binding subunit